MLRQRRLLITFVVVVVTSLVSAIAWCEVFNSQIPVFVVGVVGGIAAAAAWRFLKNIDPMQ